MRRIFLISKGTRDILQISLIWGIGWVFMIGVLFVSVSNPLVPLFKRMPVLNLTVLFYLIAYIAWFADRQRPIFSRWFLCLSATILINLGTSWLNEPSFLIILFVPVIVARTMISLPASAIVAAFGSILVLLLPKIFSVTLEPLTSIFGLTALWTTVGLMFAIYRPMYQITTWAMDHYLQARLLLEEARDGKAELLETRDELMRTNRELSLSTERLGLLRIEADEARKAKEAFVARVSHEFRTPINMIIGLADLLIETPEVYGEKLPTSLLDDLEIVQRNCRHLSNLVDDVLNLGQIESGQFSLNRDWADLREDIDTTINVVRPLVDKKKLSIRAICEPELPLVYCDRTRLRQVLLNLVSNAARFTEEGGITVSIKCEDEDILMSVADTGPGILPQESERIFEPFFQGSITASDGGGSGLGLSISRQFVEMHKGRIWLESKPEFGTTFYVRIPIVPPNQSIFVPQRWMNDDWVWQERTSSKPAPRSPDKLRVMLCDQTPTLRAITTHLQEDVEFVEAKTLEEAVHKLTQVPAHLLLANVPIRDQLLSFADNAQSEVADTPIIVCSYEDPLKRAIEAGAMNYLIKPVKADKLIEAVIALQKPIQKIMIVDDNIDLQQLLKRMLLAHDSTLQILTVSEGKEAITEIRSAQPDLILLDLVMPQMDGWEILACKSKDQSIKNIPTIIISSQDLSQQPMKSTMFVVAIKNGFSPKKVLDCSLELSNVLLSHS